MSNFQKGLENYIVNEKGCWIWQGASSAGYGAITINGIRTSAHRAMYEKFNGKISGRLFLDHIVCNTPLCINPTHVKPVRQSQNISRAYSDRTHCKHKHEFSIENTGYDRHGGRFCKKCKSERAKKYYKSVGGSVYTNRKRV